MARVIYYYYFFFFFGAKGSLFLAEKDYTEISFWRNLTTIFYPIDAKGGWPNSLYILMVYWDLSANYEL